MQIGKQKVPLKQFYLGKLASKKINTLPYLKAKRLKDALIVGVCVCGSRKEAPCKPSLPFRWGHKNKSEIVPTLEMLGGAKGSRSSRIDKLAYMVWEGGCGIGIDYSSLCLSVNCPSGAEATKNIVNVCSLYNAFFLRRGIKIRTPIPNRR
jgi:hypothetical protein